MRAELTLIMVVHGNIPHRDDDDLRLMIDDTVHDILECIVCCERVHVHINFSYPCLLFHRFKTFLILLISPPMLYL